METSTFLTQLALIMVAGIAMLMACFVLIFKRVMTGDDTTPLIAWRPYKKKIIYRDDNEPYLIRYTFCNWKIFSIKVHNILLSDPSCPHDHPWAFITLLLRGSYTEHTPYGTKTYGAGRILYRRADHVHRLEINKPVWSFVITFKKTRTWGFYTKYGWVHWRYFTSEHNCD